MTSTEGPNFGGHGKEEKSSDAVQTQTIDRSTVGLPNITSSGFHVPPQVLGVHPNEGQSKQQDEPSQSSRIQSNLADVNAKSRRRSNMAIKATKSQAAIAAATKAVSERTKMNKDTLDYSLFTFVTYEGTEIIFANTASQTLVGVCSRTHYIFQTLTLPSKAPIVSISSNSQSGMVIVAHQDGIIQIYKPIKTRPCEFGQSTKDDTPQSTFGRFRWVDCLTINAGNIFYQKGETVDFCDRRRNTVPGKLIDVSSSSNYRILVAHRQQLAVFDGSPVENNTKENNGDVTRLLWTTILPSNIVTAKISGDGQALVVVVDTPDEKMGYGALTFVHDMEDGSQSLLPPSLERSTSVGMVYKPGPFLSHSAEVSRISFRGLGRETSNVSEDNLKQGNDLLLTFCNGDSSVRIFNQNSWQQLMTWSAFPNSRADWIRGSAAFSLGDLEAQKKTKTNRQLNRRPSEESENGGGVGAGFRNNGSMGTGVPTTSAGAWIAEITFRNAFPALRLSRLSYMKRGNADSQPAHFESVAAILPAGSITAESVLNSDDMGLSIQGIWQAWNPWLADSSGNNPSNDLSNGSAMQFLGLLSSPPPTNAFGDSHFGGSHSPPTELRITASHPTTGKLVIMEFPLWGDEDFGAMEMGSPLRSVLSLSDAITSSTNESKDEDDLEIPYASMELESGRLCAKMEPTSNSISLLMRKPGSMSLYSPDWRPDEDITNLMEASENTAARFLHDMSVTPAPLALPSLFLPNYNDSDKIVELRWLPDKSFGGPPLLIAFTRTGTLLVFEIPPPWSALEPTMPNYDPFIATSSTDSMSLNEIDDPGFKGVVNDSAEATQARREEYIVKITPHPDFGLGLRLESPMDGLPAVAGSFKKNPLNGGLLPAEKTRTIVLGDELLSVNGVSLENMTFDDIIATVRHVGAESGPGEALSLEFRPATLGRSRKSSFSSGPIDMPEAPGRPKENESKGPDDESLASALLKNSERMHQEFGRLVAAIRKAFPSTEEPKLGQRLIVRPWSDRMGVSLPGNPCIASLIVLAAGSKIYLKRLELPMEGELDDASLLDLGFHDLTDEGEEIQTNPRSFEIRSIQCIESARDSMPFVVSDSLGCVKVVFIEFGEESNGRIKASFRHFSAFRLDSDSLDFQICAPSVNLMATRQRQSDKPSQTITIWSARPDPSCRQSISDIAITDEYFDQHYVPTEVKVESADWNAGITDFCFLSTGRLDSFPALVAFMRSEAIVYQRQGGKLRWQPMVRLSYPLIPGTSLSSAHEESISSRMPQEDFPHLLPSLRETVSAYDEVKSYVSDWHPESLIAHLCTDERGAKAALASHVRGVLLWLADWIDSSSNDRLTAAQSRLTVPPLNAGGVEFNLDKVAHSNGAESKDNTSAMLLTSFGRDENIDPQKSQEKKLQELLVALENLRTADDEIDTVGKSQEFKMAMSSALNKAESENLKSFRTMLSSLQPKELRALWAIVKTTVNPPNFSKVDTTAQLALALFSIHQAMKSSPIDDSKVRSVGSSSRQRTKYMPSFNVKSKSATESDTKSDMSLHNASAGCVAALLSDFQGQIVESLRQPGAKFDWHTVKELRIPFWLRSDDALKAISEEVGQKLFRDSRDILKAALYFIVAGKKRTLRNLAAADSSDGGRKLTKFLTDFDFSTERGRSAAEKNAFSLLRKNRYDCAAAFFLLAEPPFIKSAVETIVSKMQDLDLAFLVARLMGNLKSQQGGIGFGGNMMGYGGGGGYAGSSVAGFSECTKDKITFKNWKPQLCQSATDLLIDHGLPEAYGDSCFSALQLMWLERQDEASHWLSGFLGTEDGLFPTFLVDKCPPCLQQLSRDAKKSKNPTTYTMNSFINFVSGPLLLKMMQSSKRTRIASALLVSNSLSRLGFELPCLQLILQNIDLKNFKAEDSEDNAGEAKTSEKTQEPQSSIFDDFMTNPSPPATKGFAQTQQMSSSIFDSFEAPQPIKKQATNSMSSSIFDDFDVAPQAKSNTSNSATNTGQMASSIFDSFDAAPQKKAPFTSSIFDSFDIHPSTKHKSSKDVIGVQVLGKTGEGPKSKSAIRVSPLIWLEWTEQLLLDIAARRLIRELISIGGRFHGEAFEPTLTPGGKGNSSLVPLGASQVLQFHCNGDELITEVTECIEKVCKIWKLKRKNVINQALQILSSPGQHHRLCFVVLLHLSQKQFEMAEDIVRSTAQSLISSCTSLSFSNDDLAKSRQSLSHVNTLYLRRLASNLSWQLELCLWLHRGGALPLSGSVLNEAICAARVGLLVASWNQDFVCLETMLKHSPDCLVNDDNGRQLWTSLKIISSTSLGERRLSTTGASSGGWEFLVQCKRSEATEMLRPRPTGCFIIRPHPEDHGVFTLSFKTNLTPTEQSDEQPKDSDGQKGSRKASKSVKRDDVVQHAIIRLSDSGFRCGSFGPFATLMKLLEAVSSSLPFTLRFDQPPNEGVIREDGSKPSPNSAFLRRLGLSQTYSGKNREESDQTQEEQTNDYNRKRKFCLFLEALILSKVRRQLSGVAAARYDKDKELPLNNDDDASVGNTSDSSDGITAEQEFAISSRMLRPLLLWCRVMEIAVVKDLVPKMETSAALPLTQGGDAEIRKMIKQGSGVDFRSLRLGDGGDSAMVVLFEKKAAIAWFIDNAYATTEEEALQILKRMEANRVIEPVDLDLLDESRQKKVTETTAEDGQPLPQNGVKSGTRYRLVDPWEVEPLYSREAETKGASLGRNQYLAFSLGKVAASCEDVFRSIGGVNLLDLWSSTRGNISLTKAMASVQPPWERAAGGDLQLHNGMVSEPVPYTNSIRQHMYRNSIFRRLDLPQRFIALIQVELLDLKNLTSPGGSLSLTVYSLLRLKRSKSNAPLNTKSRTLDTVATSPMRLGKTSGSNLGPNLPASWGSLVRFRFPLPEETTADGKSHCANREVLFKGPPSALQVSVYEKKFMSDTALGGADVKLDGLSPGGQLEEWVPLRNESSGINWFARIRLTLRFELMCLSTEKENVDDLDELAPSVSLRRIKQLHNLGGAHEDMQKSSSTSDLLSYFESMVY